MFYQHAHAGKEEHFVKEYGRDFSFPAHIHSSFECIVLLDGEMDVTVNGNTERLTAGQAVMIFPNRVHSLSSQGSKHMLCIFSADLVSAFWEKNRGTNPFSISFRPTPRVVAALNELQVGDSELRKKGILYLLCAEFDENRQYVSCGKEENDLLSKMFLFVEENYSQNCSLSRLSQAVGYEYGYLSRYFKQKTGVSFPDYVNRFRINRACYYLTNTDKTVLDCAFSVGYESFRTFTRNFKKTVGCTAEEYKAQNRKAKRT